jgi:hypothetical protein
MNSNPRHYARKTSAKHKTHGERLGVRNIRRRKGREEPADRLQLREKRNGHDPLQVRGWRKRSEVERGASTCFGCFRRQTVSWEVSVNA